MLCYGTGYTTSSVCIARSRQQISIEQNSDTTLVPTVILTQVLATNKNTQVSIEVEEMYGSVTTLLLTTTVNGRVQGKGLRGCCH